MKKVMMLFCLVAAFALNAVGATPWKVVDMEDVARTGSNCSYDDETCTATFKGPSDRWIDLPGVSGDLTQHVRLDITVLNSTCMLKVCLRYKNSEGKIEQVTSATAYNSMKSTLENPKTIKFDLSDNGKIGDEILKNVVAIRVAMEKAVDGNEAPWIVQFGKVELY